MFGSFSDKAIKDEIEGGSEAANAKLRKLFDLPEDEHIVTGNSDLRLASLMEEFPAWLVKNVMIQGYMLVTERHICYFAALPRTDVLSLYWISADGRTPSLKQVISSKSPGTHHDETGNGLC